MEKKYCEPSVLGSPVWDDFPHISAGAGRAAYGVRKPGTRSLSSLDRSGSVRPSRGMLGTAPDRENSRRPDGVVLSFASSRPNMAGEGVGSRLCQV
jgi:hypothetical protein